MSRPRVLWIEDNARLDLQKMIGPLTCERRFHFQLAIDVTEGLRMLRSQQYDAMIIDVRLPPGLDPSWAKQYRAAGSDKITAELGLKLLAWLLGGDRSIERTEPPPWVHPGMVGIFSVESRDEIELEIDFDALRVVYEEKKAELPETFVRDMFLKLLGTAVAAPARG